MSPVRDPEERYLRRFNNDLREREREQALPRAHATRAGKERGRRPPRETDFEGSEEEELEQLPQRSGRSSRRAEVARRRATARTAEPSTSADPDRGRDLLPGVARIMALSRGPAQVELADGSIVSAHLPKVLARAYHGTLAVGDEVRLELRPSGDRAVALVLPRRSRLSRPDPLHQRRERVLAANLDLAVIVASVRRPALATGLIDRFLVALGHGDVAAALAVNKADLIDDPEELETIDEALAPYRRIGIPVVLCSARTGAGIPQLRALIEGRTVVFVGHSGVGKSSLLNALLPAAAADVGLLTASSGRGRHTTTQARTYRLDADTRVIDTPGIREFGLWRMDAKDVAAYFDEFTELATQCKFANCRHLEEPGCAVRAAAGSEKLVAERYETYLRIVASLERD